MHPGIRSMGDRKAKNKRRCILVLFLAFWRFPLNNMEEDFNSQIFLFSRVYYNLFFNRIFLLYERRPKIISLKLIFALKRKSSLEFLFS